MMAKKVLSTIVPQHVVIIPDGNRRWAKERGLPASEGHRAALKKISELAKAAREAGIRTITAWGFSTENWQRGKEEVQVLFDVSSQVLRNLAKELDQHEIRFRHLGRKDRLPKDLVKDIAGLEEKTAKYKKYNLNIALDYGGRDEILRAVKKLVGKGLKENQVNEKVFASFLDTSGLSDPDLIIRTSGEQRLSGILPWQSVYAELYFSPLYFPDFDKKELMKALDWYSARQRRFGK